MNQLFIGRDVRRCLSAAVPPAAALAGLAWFRLVSLAGGGSFAAGIADQWIRPTTTIAMVLATAWFITATTHAFATPRRDARAADLLDRLRERATWPGSSLWEIQSIEGASAAGQRAACVDVHTGEMKMLWLEQISLPQGTFVLLAFEGGQHHLIEWLDVRAVAAACRHRRGEAERTHRRAANQQRASTRLLRKDLARVLKEAENILLRPR